MAWLRALIWPEQAERIGRLQQAIAIARWGPPRMLAGDALQRLPETLLDLPSGESVCVFHVFTLNLFSSEMKQRFQAVLEEASAAQPLLCVGFEWTGEGSEVRVWTYADGQQRTNELVAYDDPHDAWIRWLAKN